MRHRRCHSGVKPFTCEICDKTFNSKANLKSHTVIHAEMINRTKIECFIKGCTKNFLYLSTFKKHLTNVHPEEFEQIEKAFPQQTFKYTIKNIFSKKFDFLIENKVDTNDQSISVGRESEDKEFFVEKNFEFSITTKVAQNLDEGKSIKTCNINNNNIKESINNSYNNNYSNYINNQAGYYSVQQNPKNVESLLSLLNILRSKSTYQN